jgi:hypothetical protein
VQPGRSRLWSIWGKRQCTTLGDISRAPIGQPLEDPLHGTRYWSYTTPRSGAQRARLSPLRNPSAMSLHTIAHVNKYYISEGTHFASIQGRSLISRLPRFAFPSSCLVPYKTLALHHTSFHQHKLQRLILKISQHLLAVYISEGRNYVGIVQENDSCQTTCYPLGRVSDIPSHLSL